MTCAHCGKPWEPTGHWCAVQPDPEPIPENPEMARLRAQVGMLQRQRAADLNSMKRYVDEVLASREEGRV